MEAVAAIKRTRRKERERGVRKVSLGNPLSFARPRPLLLLAGPPPPPPSDRNGKGQRVQDSPVQTMLQKPESESRNAETSEPLEGFPDADEELAAAVGYLLRQTVRRQSRPSRG